MTASKPTRGMVQVGVFACYLVLVATVFSRRPDLEGVAAVLVTYLVLQVIFRMMLRSADIRRRPRNLLFLP